MKNRFLLGLFFALFACASSFAQTTTISITGMISDEITGIPIEGSLVFAVIDTTAADTTTAIGVTDVGGMYNLSMDVDASVTEVFVATFDACDTFGYEVQVAQIVNQVATADFIVCADTTWGFACEAGFYTITDINDPLTVSFQDYSFGNVTSWMWDFGDGTTSTDQNPTHTYAAGGTYGVSLTIQTSDNCGSTTAQSIYLQPVFNNPVTVTGYVYYEGTTDPVPGWFVTGGTDPNDPFGGASYADTDANGFYTIVIDMDPALNSVQVATLDLCTGGPLAEMVAITNGVGTQDFYICDTWIDPPPACEAMVNINQIDDYNFSFTADIHPQGANVVSYLWDFGDGTTSTDANPSHTYTTDGIYTVFLEAELDSCTAHACEVVFVGNGHPPCDTFIYGCQAMFFMNPEPIINNNSFTFSDVSIGAVVDWEWDLGDGTIITGLPVVSHTYQVDGTYTVTLSITTVDGCESTMSMDVEAPFSNSWNEPDCQAMFLPLPIPDSITGTIGLDYFFLDMSFSIYGINSYLWDFGDGNTSTDPSPFHTYAAAGTYDVSLTINGDSCSSQIIFQIDTDNYDNFAGGGSLGQSPQANAVGVAEVVTVKGMTLSPNPVTDRAVLAFESTASKKLNYTVADMSGRTIQSWTSNSTQGMNVQTIETADLNPGMYTLFVQDEVGVQTMRFVKQ